MAKRKIIKIDEQKCNGCGRCIPNCPEGALQVIDAKARLVSDLFCDGLGACLGYCPEGAITIEERNAQEYDERKVMENIVRQGENVIRAHLLHLKEHSQHKYLQEARRYLQERKIEVRLNAEGAKGSPKAAANLCGCPGSMVVDFRKEGERPLTKQPAANAESQLWQWPIQIALVSPDASYFDNADLLIAADCVPFAYADFHGVLLQGKVLLVGCPKLDNPEFYLEKMTQILKNNNINSITYAHMEVPCCFGLIGVIESAISKSGKDIPFKKVTISIRGEKQS